MRSWNAQRVGAFVLFGVLFGLSARGLYSTVGLLRSREVPEQIGATFLDTLIPEPNEQNLQK